MVASASCTSTNVKAISAHPVKMLRPVQERIWRVGEEIAIFGIVYRKGNNVITSVDQTLDQPLAVN